MHVLIPSGQPDIRNTKQEMHEIKQIIGLTSCGIW